MSAYSSLVFDSQHRGIDAALAAGVTFTASKAEDAGGSSAHSLILRNPGGSGKEYLVYFGEATHESEVGVVVYSAISSVSGGSTPAVSNNRIGSDRSPTATVTHDATYSGDTTHTEQVYTGSGTEQLFNGHRVYLPPGEDIAVELTDQSGSADEMGIRLSWAELDP